MRIQCSTFGSAGDVFPMLGLALALRDRGHEVSFATNGHFQSIVESCGLPFFPLGTAEEYDACTRHPDLWNPRKGFSHIMKVLQPVIQQHYEVVRREAAAGDLIAVTSVLGFGALTAADALNIPAITVHLQPAVIWSDLAPPQLPSLKGPRWLKKILFRLGVRYHINPQICPFLNSWRAELGLPPIGNICDYWHSRDGVLCLFPDWFAPAQADWPQPLVQTSFPLWNHQSGRQLPDDLLEFLDRGDPPLAFTPGSANRHGKEFFAAASEACRTLKRRGLFLTQYPEQLPENLPDSIRHVRYAPLNDLLPRCAAFVHHAGVGSTSEAMLAGIPQVGVPLAHDQFDNAERARQLQTGDWISADRLTGSRLTRSLAGLLSSPTISRACRDVAGRLADRDGLSRGAEAVEILAGRC